ncbi:MAG: energy transducer TonB [Gemmatimonadota bacterium]|nr:energy transducer TonB [Candidatus Binatota bacterium]MDP9179672.1 energy transducer TonB [Gemmatimonadota bacterium]
MNRLAYSCLVLLSFGIFLLPAQAQDAEPKSIKGGVLNGKALSLPKPEYPAEAKTAGLEGMVFVDVEIDEAGTVFSAVAATDTRKVAKSRSGEAEQTDIEPADPILRDAAEQAALQAKFSPTLLNGAPVKVSGTIVYNFVARSSTSDRLANVNGGVLNGKALSLPKPPYPAAAIAVRAQGPVVVQITIDENGDVISASAVSGHPLLRAAAVEAARAAKFSPTLLSGQPVRVAGVLTYNFVAPPKEDTN